MTVAIFPQKATLRFWPARWMEEGAETGPVAGQHFSREQIDDLLNRYYKARGWTAEGLPTEAKLRELHLDFCLPSHAG
ncbi:MAG TPA: aldehyde ferredoxin oxidoreductase C-terminal domain-containing protein [Symbiobacteriaceae bacterium]|nr:aldehyde ferredoxin oxidoreductase C-terminal domain-containing protein [Symbiobacteriaceae bacterium]